MYDTYIDRGFEPIAINLGENVNTVKSFAQQYTYTFLIDQGDAAWNLYSMYGAIPLNYVVDTAGLVVNSMEGYDAPTIERWIEPYLYTGVSETPTAQPVEFRTVGANPAVGRSAVRFSLPRAAEVSLRVYSSSGALVRTLASGQLPSGTNEVSWNLRDDAGRQVGSGLYLYELVSGSQVAHAKVSVLK